MGYLNPLLKLPAARKLLVLPLEQRSLFAELFAEIRRDANRLAEESWTRRKGPMAAYWRAVSTYARHVAHVLTRPLLATVTPAQRIEHQALAQDCADRLANTSWIVVDRRTWERVMPAPAPAVMAKAA